MTHKYNQIPNAEIQRSAFDRSHGLKTTFDADKIYPIYFDEALPGDTFQLNLTAFARMTTPIVPIMDNLRMQFWFFAVPIRLIWDNFKKFMGEQVDPGDSTDYTVPKITLTSDKFDEGSIYDYFGIPTEVTVDSISINALHFRAYNLCYNEFFRDQNLIDSVTVNRDDGPDPDTDYTILTLCKTHDYFTSALPWPQKSDNGAVSIPLGTSAPVSATGGIEWEAVASSARSGDMIWSNTVGYSTGTNNFTNGDIVQYKDGLEADLSSATAATINSLREAFQLQKMYERDARGGSRYTEIIRSHFNITSPDYRLQRPEFLGGGIVPITVNPVPQTSETNTTPQGTMSAFAVASGGGIGFTQSFTEHCVILGLVGVRADLTYQQGLDRMWSRDSRFDFFWPALAHLGEQEILAKEIYVDTTQAANDAVWAYQERYAEYRHKHSLITGKYRSNATGTLEAWHLSEDFATAPSFNETFIKSTTPMSRVLAVGGEPHFLYDSYIKLRCVRPMPVYGVPGLLDHF